MTQNTLNIITIVWMAIGVITFLVLLKVTAPYGRHIRSGWGPVIGNKLGWFIQEAPAFIFLSIFYFIGNGPKTPVTWFLWALFGLHYFNRTIIYPLRIRTKDAKIPLAIVASATFFNFINGYLNGTFLGNFGGQYGNDFFQSPQFIIGISLFVLGAFINNQSDTILIGLRKPGETGYKIPVGGFFKYISCPNLFGEMVEWIGFAIMAYSLQSWSFALWACVNLIPRALEHHKWYQQKFADYPKERKALIPHVL
jgi:3-oxo-5-alpha-steroid 4-dehydrogenase 1